MFQKEGDYLKKKRSKLNKEMTHTKQESSHPSISLSLETTCKWCCFQLAIPTVTSARLKDQANVTPDSVSQIISSFTANTLAHVRNNA